MKRLIKIILCSTFFFNPFIFATQDNSSGLAGLIASATAKRVAGIAILVGSIGADALSNHLARKSGRHELLEEQEQQKKPVKDDSTWSYYPEEEAASKSSLYALGSFVCWFGAKAGYLTSGLFFYSAGTQSSNEKVVTLEKQKGLLETLVKDNKKELKLSTSPPTSKETVSQFYWDENGKLTYPI